MKNISIICLFAIICVGQNVYGQSWDGTWSTNIRNSNATLEIKKLSTTKFKFSIDSYSGANVGGIEGTATVKGKTASFSVYDKTANSTCRLKFTHTGKTIKINEQDCGIYGGNGVSFGGEYKKGKKVFKDSLVTYEVFPNQQIDNEFRKMVGKDYENFLNNLQLINEDEDKDGFGSKVFSGCVRGVCPYNAAIIMYDSNGNFWAAFVEPQEKSTLVNYFSNSPEWKNKLPKTIESWVEEKRGFNENLKVIYKVK